MPINDISHGLPRVGKIRLGIEVETKDGKTRPSKLDTFRLTSPDEVVIQAAAAVLGGEVKPWDNDGAAEFEVVTEAAVLDVLITPEADAFSQHYELWSGGGCQRRCDGFVESLTAGPCLCPSDREQRAELAKNGKACKATTRVSVVLPQIPRIGSWMLESHGFYAAKELGSTFALLDMAGARRNLLPARLRIEQRVSKRPGQPINKYGVPVLDIGMRFDELVNNAGLLAPPGVDPQTGEIGPFDQAALPAPKTSVKKAAAPRKTTAQMSQEVKGNDPISGTEFAELQGRIHVLDREHRGLVAELMKADGLDIRGGTCSRADANRVDRLLRGDPDDPAAEPGVEVKQAAAWEDRRKAVFVGFGQAYPDGITDDARHEHIAKATATLSADEGGRTGSTQTLTQAQANTILDYLDGLFGDPAVGVA